MSSLADVAIFLTAAVIAVPLFRLLKLSAIIGYIVAGVAIGPWGFGLISGVEEILRASEFGIVLLLFLIGLELQPSRLWVMRRTVFGLGSAQVIVCTLLLGGAAMLLAQPPKTAFVIGFGLSLSSTPLVLQVLAERGQLKSQQGRSAFGILLFQDLSVLPVLALMPLLANEMHMPAAHARPWWISVGTPLAVIAIVIVAGRILVRPLLRIVARIRVSEVFTAAALLTVMGTALAVNAAGLSMALGAFLAGVVLADSEFRHELEADIEPFKGLLLGLFFMAVGMSANLGLLTARPLALLATTAGFIVIKLIAITVLGKVTRHPGDSAWRLGFAMPAGGEFAFVLFTLAAGQGLLDAGTRDLLILAVTMSMGIGTLLPVLYDAVFERLLAPRTPPEFDQIEERDHRVIIAGFGRFGQIVARVLRARRITFTALESNQTHVDFVRRFGNRIYYGDASRLDLLRAAGAGTAEVFVLAIDDVEASLRAAEVVRTHFPHLKLYARARNRQHAFSLMDAGVTSLIRETYVSSLEAAEAVLEMLGDSRSAAKRTVARFREHDESTLLAQYELKGDEEKFRASVQESARQLEKLFEADSSS